MSNVLHSPSLPLWHRIPNGLQQGKVVEISGGVLYGADIFQVNFTKGMDMGSIYADRLLHISVRLQEHVVVRNAHFGGWGQEERGGGVPFVPGHPFTMLILVEQDGYHIAVNGQHQWIFRHRSSYYSANMLNIAGSVRVDKVAFYDKPSVSNCLPPASNRPRKQKVVVDQNFKSPGVPFSYSIPGALRKGMVFYIQGRPTLAPNRFSINFQSHGASHPLPDRALHFDVRFFNHTVVRNSRINDCYGPEETSIPGFPFRPGSEFSMFVEVESHCFRVAVDGRPFVEYKHRKFPLTKFTTLLIDGDLTLTSIRVSKQ